MNAQIVRVDALSLRRYQKRGTDVSFRSDEGLAKFEGRDARGKIKVWARHNAGQKFKQVGAMPNWEQAELFVRMMLNDDRERRVALRDASRMRFDP